MNDEIIICEGCEDSPANLKHDHLYGFYCDECCAQIELAADLYEEESWS